jgi:hypothetical protein
MCVNARARAEEAGLTSSFATCARPMYKPKETYA